MKQKKENSSTGGGGMLPRRHHNCHKYLMDWPVTDTGAQQRKLGENKYEQIWTINLSLTIIPHHSLRISSVPVLSLFTIVQFQNQGCAASSGDNGTCLTTSECSDRGGVASGPCANGYGVCCVCKLSPFTYGSPNKPNLSSCGRYYEI
jgi:hypothetical protein